MFLILVDIKELCMQYISLPLLKGLVVRPLLEPNCLRFNI